MRKHPLQHRRRACRQGKHALPHTGRLPLTFKALCHCADCRKISGSTYSTNAIFPSTQFKVTQGTPKQHSKTADSGNVITSHFWYASRLTDVL